ncbi:glutathione S-transferase [Pseudaestuariivita atlantica]|uniref:Glutathione S-transferase n=1 Tax=Pseudaestuariivita atlantica TaxID=1317121 RepID=A0A0L1JT86_9RHOB|nr:glutathione S-transferase [Pseudaestuariivita atlantica]KNG94974.1 glutathione S-transferase [Pseudaestuariivita atlantica]
MTYILHIGDYAYSSWSLRGWLMLHRFGLDFETRLVDFNAETVAAQMARLAPARTVPCLEASDGSVMSDTLAMAEELATRHPDIAFWPSAPRARAAARSLVAEMHSSFSDLRSDCPMNLRASYSGFSPSDGVLSDLERICTLWSHAHGMAEGDGPWLFGAYTLTDAFYAPVAARIATYDLPVDDAAARYVAAHLADPAFRRWRALGLVVGDTLPWYAMDHAPRPWPGPSARAAHAVEHGPAVNETCPYSGKPVTHFLEMEGKTYGFCNATCRDKTVADPDAWPAFTALASG